MKNEIKVVIYFVGIGMSLVAYAHLNFSTKGENNTLHQDVRELRKEVSEIKTLLIRISK